MLCAGSFFNTFADVAPVIPDGLLKPSKDVGVFLAACNAVLYAVPAAVVAMPPVNGKPWFDAAASSAFAFAGTAAVLSLGTLAAKRAKPEVFTSPAIKNLGVPIYLPPHPPTAGPVLMFALTTARMICQAVDAPPNDYAKALIGVSSIPGFTELLRIGISPLDPATCSDVRAGIAAAVDLSTGLMTAIPCFKQGPDIPPQTLKRAVRNDEYSDTVVMTGEFPYNVPLKWSLGGTGKPAWLTIDLATGKLSGTPTVAGRTQPFTVTVTDSFAPPQSASHTFVIEVD